MLAIRNTLHSVVTQTSRLVRDLWNKINDTWANEQRKWENII